jgi:xanthine dehydrogenase small subunit
VIAFELNGAPVEVPDDGASLLDVLREHCALTSVKDGCSPQGQCGCCTVWVDGGARVACVTPVARVRGRVVTTIEGLAPAQARRWADAFVATGASQCGFCTPGIVMRLAALEKKASPGTAEVHQALLAHLCRCTGWQSVVEAAQTVLSDAELVSEARDPLLSQWRAQLEGPAFQSSGPEVVLGDGGFADDRAPRDALVALPSGDDYVVAPSLGEARRRSAKVQGRHTTLPLRHPLALPAGAWDLVLRTTWVEPAYLEPDASWCRPGGIPASPLANGGAFGGKRTSPVGAVARQLADEHGAPVRVLWPREEAVRRGPKRPPVAIAVRSDGTGVLRVGLSPDSPEVALYAERVAAVAPGLVVEPVAVPGPPTSCALRGAGWVEATVVQAALGTPANSPVEVTAPGSGRARVAVGPDGVTVEVWAGEVLDEVVLRSYCLGAVHQALGWVWHEGIAVDEEGRVQDLTIRSFSIMSARETPAVHVTIHPQDTVPRGVSDAVFAACAAAAWIAEGTPKRWPTRSARLGAEG